MVTIKLSKDKNTIWLGHSQFGPDILVIVNLVFIIYNLQSIWSLHFGST